MKSNIFIRIARGTPEKMSTVDLCDCLDAELAIFFETKNQAELIRWLIALVNILKEA